MDRPSDFRDLTPLVDQDDFDGPSMSPRDAELVMCRATCADQRQALTVLEGQLAEKTALVEELRADRRALAERVRVMEAYLKRSRLPFSK